MYTYTENDMNTHIQYFKLISNNNYLIRRTSPQTLDLRSFSLGNTRSVTFSMSTGMVVKIVRIVCLHITVFPKAFEG